MCSGAALGHFCVIRNVGIGFRSLGPLDFQDRWLPSGIRGFAGSGGFLVVMRAAQWV